MPASQLLLGTTSGVYSVAAGLGAQQGAVRLLTLRGAVITHLAVAPSGAAAAAVPRLALGPGELHALYPFAASLPADNESSCGLHLLRHAASSTGGNDGGGGGAYSSERVWSGDARSCCAWDIPSGSASGEVGLAVGTEPADVFTSADSGRSWSAGTGGFGAAPSRQRWTFPAAPHEPHVLSLERLPPPGAASVGGSSGEAGCSGGRLVAGIEVGGVLVGPDAPAGASPSSVEARGSAWRELNEGVYADVHSCRVDPHDSAHWLVVTGRGLYASGDAGASWAAAAPGMWKGRYTVGLAFNPQRRGEVLVAAGDRPPGVGVHMYRSTDGGSSWSDITGSVFGGACGEAKGGCTPVPFFWGGQALVGTDTGHLLAAADGERQHWRAVCQAPAPILCMAAAGQSPSSIMH